MVEFNPATDIPSLNGKVILVTGGNIGLGRETVLQLAQHGPSKIVLAARNKAKADATIQELNVELNAKSQNKTPIEFLELDLTSFASIKSAANKFKAENKRLDLLINNAGIMACPGGLTKEGYEIQFGTNHLGHALLTKCLMPTLQETAKGAADVRVVTLSSGAESFAPPNAYVFDQIKTPTAGLGTWARYGQSKLANVHYSRAMSQRHPSIKFVAVHPGSVSTNLLSGPAASYAPVGWFIKTVGKLLLTPVQKGAWNQLWASTSPEAKTGVFYWPVALEGKDSKLAKNDELCEKLYTWTQKELEGHD